MREFPPFRLDTVNQCLWRGDGVAEERIPLAPKAFDVLRYLVEHPGRLVPHDELLGETRDRQSRRARPFSSTPSRGVLEVSDSMWLRRRSGTGLSLAAPGAERNGAAG